MYISAISNWPFTNHSLISTIEAIKSEIDSGSNVGGVFMDLQKAFDTVNRDILCEKRAFYGFRGNSQLLIKSFFIYQIVGNMFLLLLNPIYSVEYAKVLL